jgi:SAM-dependent MidA family methyltransferase
VSDKRDKRLFVRLSSLELAVNKDKIEVVKFSRQKLFYLNLVLFQLLRESEANKIQKCLKIKIPNLLLR